MTEAGTAVAEHACARLALACYSWMDQGDYEAVTDLFTEDATWVRGGKPFVGKTAIREALAKRSPADISRHLITNLIVTLRGADEADATAYFIPLRASRAADGPAPMPGIDSMGDLVFRFARTGDGWKISFVQPTPVLKA